MNTIVKPWSTLSRIVGNLRAYLLRMIRKLVLSGAFQILYNLGCPKYIEKCLDFWVFVRFLTVCNVFISNYW